MVDSRSLFRVIFACWKVFIVDAPHLPGNLDGIRKSCVVLVVAGNVDADAAKLGTIGPV